MDGAIRLHFAEILVTMMIHDESCVSFIGDDGGFGGWGGRGSGTSTFYSWIWYCN